MSRSSTTTIPLLIASRMSVDRSRRSRTLWWITSVGNQKGCNLQVTSRQGPWSWREARSACPENAWSGPAGLHFPLRRPLTQEQDVVAECPHDHPDRGVGDCDSPHPYHCCLWRSVFQPLQKVIMLFSMWIACLFVLFLKWGSDHWQQHFVFMLNE